MLNVILRTVRDILLVRSYGPEAMNATDPIGSYVIDLTHVDVCPTFDFFSMT
jgi:hypothetical protein